MTTTFVQPIRPSPSRADGSELCVETFGDPADPALLLIMGSVSSMKRWDDAFCARLAAADRYVVRYDNRDTGRSVKYPPGAPGYGFPDLVTDAIGVLDALDIASAHLVGVSMGGMIAQVAALDRPERVASLVLLSTSPGGPGPHNPDLSPAAPAFLAHMTNAEVPDVADRAAFVEWLVDVERICAGRSRFFDETAMRELAGRIFDHDDTRASMTNHWVMDFGAPWRDRLGELRMPTLVVHGTEDPVFPLDHGQTLAREIPSASLRVVEDMGHEVPPRPTWHELVGEIAAQTTTRDEGERR